MSANPRDVLGATLASHGDKQSSGCNRSLQVPPIPGQPLPVIWARMLRDQTRANGQPPRSLKRPRLSYAINRFDTTKYFKIEQRWKWATQHSTIFCAFGHGDRPFRRLAAIHRTGFESQCACLPAFLAQYSVHSRCARYSLMRDEVRRAHKLRHLDFSTWSDKPAWTPPGFLGWKIPYDRQPRGPLMAAGGPGAQR